MLIDTEEIAKRLAGLAGDKLGSVVFKLEIWSHNDEFGVRESVKLTAYSSRFREHFDGDTVNECLSALAAADPDYADRVEMALM